MPVPAEVLERTHLAVRPEHLEAARRYNVPVEIVATARGDPGFIARAVAYAENRELWRLAAGMEDKVALVGTPRAVAPAGDGRIEVRFPSGARILVALPDGMRDPVQVLEYFSDTLYIEAEKRTVSNGGSKKRVWVARRVKRVTAREDREALAAALEWAEREVDAAPPLLAVVALALNYDPASLPVWAWIDITVRAIPAVNERAHAAYLTVPGTGKTHTAILYRHALNWVYYPKPPTPASLVADARSGAITAIRHAGVWLDEMDKWAKAENRERLAQAIEIMLTGTENCEWVREAGGEKAVRITKCVPFMFTGNVGTMAAMTGARNTVIDMVEPVGEAAAQALVDRIAAVYVNAYARAPEMVKAAIQGVTPRRAFVRAVFAEARARLARLGGPVHSGHRSARHRENVRRTLLALGYPDDAADRLAEMLVGGYVLTREDAERGEGGGEA